MPVTATNKLDIACELLDRGLRLYYEGDSDYSALHLAGAAEEIFGSYVIKHDGETAFENLRSATVKISAYLDENSSESSPKEIADIMNHAKNNTKHGSGEVSFSARSEAKDLLDRAIQNYYYLMRFYELEETELIIKFKQE
jgi:hypothetical protein